MRSPGGWVEPGQSPDFDEYTVVLKGLLRVEHRDGVLDVRAGQADPRRARGMGRATAPPSGKPPMASAQQTASSLNRTT